MVKKIILILLFVSVSFFGFANDVPARCEKYVEALETELAEVKDALAETNEMLATVTDALEVTTEKYVEAKEQIKADQVEIETLRD
jgi:chromosome segregation ATPase